MIANAAQSATPPPGMGWVPGGFFDMGSDQFYPEEGPVRRVEVDGFWMDRSPVTNRDFSRFVKETGYRTLAECDPDPSLYPGVDPTVLKAGSIVFDPPLAAHDPRAKGGWWRFVHGACWRRPDGQRDLRPEEDDHPVVHVAHGDAVAYAAWAERSLPSEAEWEFAARGGLSGKAYAWGDGLKPGGRRMANTWDGDFPFRAPGSGAEFSTSPVGRYPANAFGLFDMIGNVWEWTDDYWSGRRAAPNGCCASRNPRQDDAAPSFDPLQPSVRIPRMVLKGGSYLCAPNYCRRYRPAARHPEMVDSATTNIGFRCVLRVNAAPFERRAS